MHRILAIFLLTVTTMSASAMPGPDTKETLGWLYGYWELATDEDGGLRGMDVDEFRRDGTYSILGPDCKPHLGHYHVFDGDIYVTFDISGKGPIAMIFRPSPTKKTLTYTSPRTRNNATYEKPPGSPCARG
jgi:hypothetical protein